MTDPKTDPTIRLLTIIKLALEALEDIGPNGTQLGVESMMMRAKKAEAECRSLLDEWRVKWRREDVVRGDPLWVKK